MSTAKKKGKAEVTRSRILDAARQLFGTHGYDGVSVRAIAAKAGVDQALVHRYFGTKYQLFLAAVQRPMDSQQLIARILNCHPDERGKTLVVQMVTMWDNTPGISALIRTMLGSEAAGASTRAALKDHLLSSILGPLHLDGPDGELRCSLILSHLIGLAVSRVVIQSEPLHSLSAEEVGDLVGPTIQRYIADPLEGSTDYGARGGVDKQDTQKMGE